MTLTAKNSEKSVRECFEAVQSAGGSAPKRPVIQ
jgi:hypothetical protein